MALPRYEGVDPLPDILLKLENLIQYIIQAGDPVIMQEIFEIFYQYNLINPLYLSWIYSVECLIDYDVQKIIVVDTPEIIPEIV